MKLAMILNHEVPWFIGRAFYLLSCNFAVPHFLKVEGT